jgi:hypothetical protein
MTEPHAKPRRVVRVGKPCKALVGRQKVECGADTMKVYLDHTPYPTVIYCPKCDQKDDR